MILRWSTVISAALDGAVATVGAALLALVLRGCGAREIAPVASAVALAVVKIVAMAAAGVAQAAAAAVVAGRAIAGSVALHEDRDFRQARKRRYRRWILWTRFGMLITVLQFAAALYLIFIFAKDFSSNDTKTHCSLGREAEAKVWKKALKIIFLVLVCLAVVIQCSTGSDVLRWRSFYSSHDIAWKAHYRELFDQGIREVFCCLGRRKYLSVLEEDEVYSVARLLGDLVAYRASGTGHLELLAGLALLRKFKHTPKSYGNLPQAPEKRLREAAFLHKFAEAAYTGPLLDLGRNPVIFPCAWLHRQGFLTPWTRNRRPVLDGDNWWRGHAAAYINYANIPPEALRYGRASQTKREAAYFVVVLHDERKVVVAVRGTETLEDVITDGLCSDCPLSADDLDGVINSKELPPQVRDAVRSSSPHYGHSGMVEYARDLFTKLNGDSSAGSPGILSSLLGGGCECDGYKLRIVGHSLGGAVATLLGIRLYGKYPNLHVYTYGSLPCVDSVIAEACSSFVTSIVNNDEFSCRLSMKSILRLRSAAFKALAIDTSENSAQFSNFLQRLLQAKKSSENIEQHLPPSSAISQASQVAVINDYSSKRSQLKYTVQGGAFLCGLAVSCMMKSPVHSHIGDLRKVRTIEESEVECSSDVGTDIVGEISSQPEQNLSHVEGSFLCYLRNKPSSDLKCFENDGNSLSIEIPTSGAMEESLNSGEMSEGKFTELYLPGLVVHLIRIRRNKPSGWRGLTSRNEPEYEAFIADRNSFKDIVVSPYMFLDHLPWRCQYAMDKVLESRKLKGQHGGDQLREDSMV